MSASHKLWLVSDSPVYAGFVVSYNMDYKYLGDKMTDIKYKGQLCDAIRRDGKCIRGKNSNMLVKFEDGTVVNVLARLLRKKK